MPMGNRSSIPQRKAWASVKVRNREKPLAEHVEALRNWGLYDLDIERAERLREILESLHEINKRIPVIVEGKRDVAALRGLGFTGEIIPLHGGKGLYEFCEDLADRFCRVVLLMDWDEQGDALHVKLAGHLKGLWEEFAFYREVMRALCQKDVKDMEGVPTLLERLTGTRVTVGDAEER